MDKLNSNTERRKLKKGTQTQTTNET